MKILALISLATASLALAGCASIGGTASSTPAGQEYDYVLSCKLKQDDPAKCAQQIKALCASPQAAETRKSRVVDPVDNSVVYVYQVRCGE